MCGRGSGVPRPGEGGGAAHPGWPAPSPEPEGRDLPREACYFKPHTSPAYKIGGLGVRLSLSEGRESLLAAGGEAAEGLSAPRGQVSEGGGALERGAAGRIPAPLSGAHRGCHHVQGLLEGPPHRAHPLSHVCLGHGELVAQVIHEASLEEGGRQRQLGGRRCQGPGPSVGGRPRGEVLGKPGRDHQPE